MTTTTTHRMNPITCSRCKGTDGLYPGTWAMEMTYCHHAGTITGHSGCSHCRNDIREMLDLPLLDDPKVVLLQDRLAGRGAGSQMRLC